MAHDGKQIIAAISQYLYYQYPYDIHCTFGGVGDKGLFKCHIYSKKGNKQKWGEC